MEGFKIDYLSNSKEPGKSVMEFVTGTRPNFTVYDFCKVLKENPIKRLDIVNILEGYFFVWDIYCSSDIYWNFKKLPRTVNHTSKTLNNSWTQQPIICTKVGHVLVFWASVKHCQTEKLGAAFDFRPSGKRGWLCFDNDFLYIKILSSLVISIKRILIRMKLFFFLTIKGP